MNRHFVSNNQRGIVTIGREGSHRLWLEASTSIQSFCKCAEIALVNAAKTLISLRQTKQTREVYCDFSPEVTELFKRFIEIAAEIKALNERCKNGSLSFGLAVLKRDTTLLAKKTIEIVSNIYDIADQINDRGANINVQSNLVFKEFELAKNEAISLLNTFIESRHPITVADLLAGSVFSRRNIILDESIRTKSYESAVIASPSATAIQAVRTALDLVESLRNSVFNIAVQSATGNTIDSPCTIEQASSLLRKIADGSDELEVQALQAIAAASMPIRLAVKQGHIMISLGMPEIATAIFIPLRAKLLSELSASNRDLGPLGLQLRIFAKSKEKCFEFGLSLTLNLTSEEVSPSHSANFTIDRHFDEPPALNHGDSVSFSIRRPSPDISNLNQGNAFHVNVTVAGEVFAPPETDPYNPEINIAENNVSGLDHTLYDVQPEDANEDPSPIATVINAIRFVNDIPNAAEIYIGYSGDTQNTPIALFHDRLTAQQHSSQLEDLVRYMRMWIKVPLNQVYARSRGYHKMAFCIPCKYFAGHVTQTRGHESLSFGTVTQELRRLSELVDIGSLDLRVLELLFDRSDSEEGELNTQSEKMAFILSELHQLISAGTEDANPDRKRSLIIPRLPDASIVDRIGFYLTDQEHRLWGVGGILPRWQPNEYSDFSQKIVDRFAQITNLLAQFDEPTSGSDWITSASDLLKKNGIVLSSKLILKLFERRIQSLRGLTKEEIASVLYPNIAMDSRNLIITHDEEIFLCLYRDEQALMP